MSLRPSASKPKKFSDIKKEIQKETLEGFLGTVGMPHNYNMEELVLGGILIDIHAINKVRNFDPDYFYKEEHLVVARAIKVLADNYQPIDYEIVRDQIQKNGELQIFESEALCALFLTQLTDKITATEHILKHWRIVTELHWRRELIIKASTAVTDAANLTHDIFDLRNHLSDNLRTTAFDAILRVRTASQVFMDAENEPDALMLAGALWRQMEVNFLFAEPGCGKTVLAMMIADRLSRGQEVMRDILPNEVAKPIKVLFFDFELTDKQFQKRYSNWDEIERKAKEYHNFHETNFLRIDMNPENLDYSGNVSDRILLQLESEVRQHKPEAIILDNLSKIAERSTQDAEVSIKIMDRLNRIKMRDKIAVLVVAHTPKVYNTASKLTMYDMAGSSNLMNFCDGMIGMRKSKLDDNMTYIKQVKVRGGELVYGEHNVICTDISKHGAKFLQHNFIRLGPEEDHLSDFLDKDDQDALIAKAVALKNTPKVGGGKWTNDEILKELKWGISVRSLQMKIKKYQDGAPQYEFPPVQQD